MQKLSVLIVGGGIGGLTSAIALCQRGFNVEIIEKDPQWSVYGVGIIQQANVVRAMDALGVVEDFIDAGFGFDFTEIYLPNGELAARIQSERLVENSPSQVGIRRTALQKVLADRAITEGAKIRLGIVVSELVDHGPQVSVSFSDGSEGTYDLVIGADGVNSQMRELLFPDAMELKFAGQAVWRYNLPKPKDMDALRAFEGKLGLGLVPMSDELMYIFVTTPEPDNPRYPEKGLAEVMRGKLRDAPPGIAEYVDQITEDSEVVYRPLAWHFLEGDWYKGNVVLIGDAAHGTTPHLGQGAGMAVEDSLVLAEELAQSSSIIEALTSYQKRRYDRCKYIVNSSVAICRGQTGKGPLVNYPKATMDMFVETAKPL